MSYKIRIIIPAKEKQDWLAAGCRQYAAWLRPYCHLETSFIRQGSEKLPPAKTVAEEGRGILARLRPQDLVVALDLAGRQYTSEQLAGQLSAWLAAGAGRITFVIGGAYGLADPVLARAQHRLSLSSLTLTHQMTRLLLLEQCYRSFCILQKRPYHK